VAGLKYRDQRASVPFVAGLMVGAASCAVPDAAVTVTWAPTTRARQRERGFDHAELLARAVARRMGVRCRRLLVRSSGPAQTGRDAAERRGDPPCFTLRSRRVPATIVLVDDVVTTGATLSAAARTLRLGGAELVIGLVAGATPPRARPG
jgi:predicted amidophosphoribosyltransferase